MSINARLGLPHDFTYINSAGESKTYKVSLFTENVRASIEKLIFKHAKDALLETRDCYTKEEYQEEIVKLREDYLKGKYAYETPKGSEFTQTLKGLIQILKILFNVDANEMIDILTNAKDEVMELLEVIMLESYPLIKDKEEPSQQIEEPNFRSEATTS